VKVSIAITNYSWSGGAEQPSAGLLDVARRADTIGVDTLWIADHLLQMDPNARIDEPMLEAYTTLGFLAAATERVGLGAMVTWASIRPPALLLKAVSTLDALSGGRAWLGLGAGYRGDEAAMMGLPFPSTGERFARLEELLQLADHLWSGDESPFDGPYHRLERPLDRPAPRRRPRVLIGGTGERRTLPLVARYADACNLFDVPDGGTTVRHKLEVLAAECAAIGRPRTAIEVTLSTRLAPGESAAGFVERCATLGAAGIDHVVLVGNGPWTAAPLAVVGEALSAM
jgi:F420-dependent oxidoreductase-like protein